MQYKFTLVCWICFRVDIRLVSTGSADPDPVQTLGISRIRTFLKIRNPDSVLFFFIDTGSGSGLFLNTDPDPTVFQIRIRPKQPAPQPCLIFDLIKNNSTFKLFGIIFNKGSFGDFAARGKPRAILYSPKRESAKKLLPFELNGPRNFFFLFLELEFFP